MSFPNFQVLGASLAVRLGRPDELLKVGCYGWAQSRAEAERLAATVPHPAIVPGHLIGVFPNEDLWREVCKPASTEQESP